MVQSAQISYDSESVRKAAEQAGFTIEFNPLVSAPLLLRDTAVDRVYFHLSGGRGQEALGIGRGAGRSTMYSLLTRSSREQWNRDHRDAWTLLRKNEAVMEFIDYYVCANGKERITAGTFPERSAYPDVIPRTLVEHPSFHGEGLDALFGGNYGQATGLDDYANPILHQLSQEDKMMLALRDYRWENFSNTQREIYWMDGMLFTGMTTMLGVLVCGALPTATICAVYESIQGSPALPGNPPLPEWIAHVAGVGTVIGATIGLAYGIKDVLSASKDEEAEDLSLDTLLFNENVIRYLESVPKLSKIGQLLVTKLRN